MSDLGHGSNNMMQSFKDAEKTGTGLLHNEFKFLLKGDLIFSTSVNDKGIRSAYHVMIATGQIRIDADGRVWASVIHASGKGNPARYDEVEINSNHRIGHT